MSSLVKKFLNVCIAFVTRFFADRLTYSACALTFTTLLALVPLLTIITKILTLLPGFTNLNAKIQTLILNSFIPTSSEIINKHLQEFITKTSSLSFIGIVFLIITVIMALLTIERTFNDIWQVNRRHYSVFKWIKYWIILSLVPLFIALSLAFTSYIASVPLLVKYAGHIKLQTAIFYPLPFIFMLFGLTLLYYLLPNCKVPFRFAAISGLIVTILFEIAKKIFLYSIINLANYKAIYGAISALPIFLLWLYFLWVIVLFGALLSNILTNNFAKTLKALNKP